MEKDVLSSKIEIKCEICSKELSKKEVESIISMLQGKFSNYDEFCDALEELHTEYKVCSKCYTKSNT